MMKMVTHDSVSEDLQSGLETVAAFFVQLSNPINKHSFPTYIQVRVHLVILTVQYIYSRHTIYYRFVI